MPPLSGSPLAIFLFSAATFLSHDRIQTHNDHELPSGPVTFMDQSKSGNPPNDRGKLLHHYLYFGVWTGIEPVHYFIPAKTDSRL